MNDEGRHKGPIDHVLDLFVYVPLGFVAEAPRLLPRFARRGRDQVAMVRAVGMYAITRDKSELEDVIHDHPETRSTLRALGLVPKVDPSSNGSAPADDDRSSGSATSGDVRADGGSDGHGARGSTPVEEPEPRQPSGIDPETLAIPDYESLSASQVVPRLASLTVDELEDIRRYENGNRARRTILNKIAQLQSS